MSFSKSLEAASVVALPPATATLAHHAVLRSADAPAFDTGSTLFVGDGKGKLWGAVACTIGHVRDPILLTL